MPEEKQAKMAEETQTKCWAGIDWGGEEHSVHVVHADGRRESWRVPHEPGALDELARRLKATPGLVGVAVEIDRGVLVAALLQRNVPVHAVNPKMAACWREGRTVAGSKDDDGDASSLAEGFRDHEPYLPALRPDDALTRTLAGLSEDEAKFVKERAGLLRSLKSALKAYFPAFLDWFEDLSWTIALDFLEAFPTARALADAPDKKVFGFFKARRAGLPPDRQERIRNRASALDWPADPVDVEVLSRRAKCIARQIRALNKEIRAYRKEIDALFAAHPDSAIFASLPGAAEKTAPRLLGCFGADRGRYAGAEPLEALSGCAPVTQRSGKRTSVVFRRACQKHFRTVMFQFAHNSLLKCEWARRCYDLARARGQNRARALRTVGQKWLRIIYRMWQDGVPYDEARHMRSLAKRGSPLAGEPSGGCGKPASQNA